MNAYPFIGKFKSAVEMFFNRGRSVVIESGHGTGRHESKFKNITTEYLANTYGEVKSKEHAEFIKLLAENHDIPCAVLSIDMNYTMFYVIDGCLFFCLKDIDVVGDYNKITIPLPPELVQAQITDCQPVIKIIDSVPTLNETITYEMKNNGDNLIFGDADKCKEWPCIGDEVKTNFGKGVVELLPDVKGCFVVQVNGGYLQLKRDELSKPKTPEEELVDEIESIFRAFSVNDYLRGRQRELAIKFIDDFNIKPQ